MTVNESTTKLRELYAKDPEARKRYDSSAGQIADFETMFELVETSQPADFDFLTLLNYRMPNKIERIVSRESTALKFLLFYLEPQQVSSRIGSDAIDWIIYCQSRDMLPSGECSGFWYQKMHEMGILPEPPVRKSALEYALNGRRDMSKYNF